MGEQKRIYFLSMSNGNYKKYNANVVSQIIKHTRTTRFIWFLFAFTT